MFGDVDVPADQTLNGQSEYEAKCVVRCRACGEDIVRPWRLRFARHQCKDWLHINPTYTNHTVEVGKAHDGIGSRITHTSNHEVRDVPIRLECRLVHPDAQLPLRKRVSDAGHDVASVVDIVVPPHGAANVDTGIIVVAPEGWYLTIEGRSSMWMRGVAPFRGIIDAGYTGPLMVAMMNVSDTPYQITKGDRIAQILLHKIQHFDLAVVDDLSPEYCIRGTNGFGSSGR